MAKRRRRNPGYTIWDVLGGRASAEAISGIFPRLSVSVPGGGLIRAGTGKNPHRPSELLGYAVAFVVGFIVAKVVK